MLKKVLIIFLIPLLFLSSKVEQVYAKDPPLKAIYGDASYGKAGFGISAGFRWWLFSANLGLAGFANKIPNYAIQSPLDADIRPTQPLPEGFEEERYSSTQISFDLGLHVDYYDPISIFLHLGVFTAQDTVLAARIDERGRTTRFRYRNEVLSGLAYGGGVEYIYSNMLSFALGYHTRKGVFLRAVYTWW